MLVSGYIHFYIADVRRYRAVQRNRQFCPWFSVLVPIYTPGWHHKPNCLIVFFLFFFVLNKTYTALQLKIY